MSFALDPARLATIPALSTLLATSASPPTTPANPTDYSRYPNPAPSNFKSVSAHQLIHWLQATPQDLLVLDVRNVGAYHQAKIKDSVGFNLPTTLLKRPLYTVDRIEANLDSPADKARFARFRTALSSTPNSHPAPHPPIDRNASAAHDHPIKRIIILDGETSVPNLPTQHTFAFILRKFEAAGFKGDLNWLMGGFTAFSRLPDAISVIEKDSDHARQAEAELTSAPIAAQSSDPPGTGAQAPKLNNSLRMSISMPPSLTTSPTHTISHFGSNVASSSRQTCAQTTAQVTKPRPKMTLDMFTRMPAALHAPDFVPDKDQSRADPNSSNSRDQNTTTHDKSHPASTHTVGRARAAVNPFFDNIRQLNEHLSLDVSLKNLSPIRLPKLRHPERDLPRLPAFFRRLLEEGKEDRARRLAHEFHDIEMAEQRRLQDVMRWHSSQRAEIKPSSGRPRFIPVGGTGEGGVLDGASEHPFSISAGVELGYKNRYKNIWPWEHARIRLKGQPGHQSGGTDYVNASLIKFELGDEKRVEPRRYIATQGPLASTFDDFWSIVCEEDVGLIVMLTKRHEAGREKCGDYLRSGRYGEIVISIEPSNEDDEPGTGTEETDDFFGFAASAAEETYRARGAGEQSPAKPALTGRAVVTTTIRLSRVTRPEIPARRIKHVQYRNWPDFDVPPAVDELLEVVDRCRSYGTEIVQLNRSIQTKYETERGEQEIERVVGTGSGPVVVHCSAGVGRTGSFIAVDVMTEVLQALYVEGGEVEEALVGHRGGRKWMDIEEKNGQDRGRSSLPAFLETEHCDCRSGFPPALQSNPIMPLVNEMREQRMSMVANYRQYVFVHEVLLFYLLRELKIPFVEEG